MYADRAEEVQRQSNYDSRRYSSSSHSNSPPLADRRVRRDSRSSRYSTPPEESRKTPRTVSAAQRESELAAQLRKRNANGKGTARSSRGRSASRSPSARSRSRSPRSRDDDRRRRRRGDEDYEDEARDSRRGSARPSLEHRLDSRDDRRSERAVSRVSANRYDEDRRGGGGREGREPPRAYYDRGSDPYERDRRAPLPPRGSYYDRDPYARSRGDYRDNYHHQRSSSPRRAPIAARRPERVKTPERVEDYELRSVFCSQLAARLGQRDLGEFFEEHLGEGAVKDVRIVTDRVTGRHKGIGYVELRDEELVPRAVQLSGTQLFGIPIFVQLTEAARNRGEGASTAQAPIRPNISGITPVSTAPPEPIKVPIIDPALLANIPAAPHFAGSNLPLHIAAGMSPAAIAAATRGSHVNAAARLYVGQLHFEITDADLKSVFDPFGTIDNVEIHRDPTTGRSKGFAFVQYRSAEDAEKAIVHMDNFELAGRPIRVGHVNSRGMEGRTTSQVHEAMSGATATNLSSLDDGGGGGLTASSRASLMEKLARTQQPVSLPKEQLRPTSIPQATSRAVLLKNMFSPEEETERDWDVELADEVKGECEAKYGPVEKCHVDKESAGEIWLRFGEVESAAKAIAGLNGRYFGGRTVVAHYVSESMMSATLG